MTETEISATRAQAKKPRTRRLTGLLVLAVLILLGGTAFLAVQWIRTRALLQDEVAGIARDATALKSQTEGLEQRLAALEKSTAETQSASSQLGDLTTRLVAAEDGIARAADQDALAQLQMRIARLESTSPGEASRQTAAVLARAELARAAETGAPLTAALSALRAVAPQDPALAALEPASEMAVPTRAMLVTRFPAAARAALDAEYTGAAEDNFFVRFWTSLRHLVRVRRLSAVDGMTSEDRLARAQADCDRGDLQSAVRETHDVTGPAATALQSWLKDADARLALDGAIAEMNARTVQLLAAPEPAEPALSSPIPPRARATSRP